MNYKKGDKVYLGYSNSEIFTIVSVDPLIVEGNGISNLRVSITDILPVNHS